MTKKTGHEARRHSRGPTSYTMHDPALVFGNMRIRPGDTCLDLGCGPGDYTKRLLELVGPTGAVYALDRDRTATQALADLHEPNLTTVVHDLLDTLPLAQDSIDVCLISTVLHAVGLKNAGRGLFQDIQRVLRPGGELAIIECTKEEQPWGPPKELRISPQEIEAVATPKLFTTTKVVELGATYLITLRPVKE